MPPRRIGPLIAALLALSPVAATSQEASPPAPLAVEAGVRATSLRSESSVMWGGAVLVRPARAWSVGGAGWLLPGVRRIDPEGPGGGLRLRVSYGGAMVGTALARRGSARVDARLLAGAGNARIELPVEEAEIAADNFLVLEPELATAWELNRTLSLVLGLSYRFISGVEDIAGVTAGQLRGASVTFTARFHR